MAKRQAKTRAYKKRKKKNKKFHIVGLQKMIRSKINLNKMNEIQENLGSY